MANGITLLRVILAFSALVIAKINTTTNLLAVILIIASLLLDAVDGFIARRLDTSDLRGSIYDILADRIIENIFFIYFAAMSLFSVWFAIIMVVRGFTIDAVRTINAYNGKTAFGETTFQREKWAKFFTCSRITRGLYNIAKMITFVCFASLLIPNRIFLATIPTSVLEKWSLGFLWITLILAILRAIPVILEGIFTTTPLKSEAR
jgi:CDP-diacylglycerol---glycerol-3-phosphate 3-phosphatidyltransferase